MNPAFRLSRLEAPQATAWSVAALIFASILFGVWALSAAPLAEPTTVSDGGHGMTRFVDRLDARR